MPVIPEVKCRRCGETFSSLRSRCPNCGTRRVAQSGRTPSPTPGTVKGTASYERAETNTKWQIIFGLILVAAVVGVHPFEDFLDGSRHRDRRADRVGAVKGIVQILDVQIDLEARLVVAGDHHRCLGVHDRGAG